MIWLALDLGRSAPPRGSGPRTLEADAQVLPRSVGRFVDREPLRQAAEATLACPRLDDIETDRDVV